MIMMIGNKDDDKCNDNNRDAIMQPKLLSISNWHLFENFP